MNGSNGQWYGGCGVMQKCSPEMSTWGMWVYCRSETVLDCGQRGLGSKTRTTFLSLQKEVFTPQEEASFTTTQESIVEFLQMECNFVGLKLAERPPLKISHCFDDFDSKGKAPAVYSKNFTVFENILLKLCLKLTSVIFVLNGDVREFGLHKNRFWLREPSENLKSKNPPCALWWQCRRESTIPPERRNHVDRLPKTLSSNF